MDRAHHPTAPARPDRASTPKPRPDDWLVLTDADRAMADVSAALDRTCRWQGDAD